MKTFSLTKNSKGTLLLVGPFCLLQLWLNATFEPSLTTNQTDHPIGGPRVRPVDKGLLTQESLT